MITSGWWMTYHLAYGALIGATLSQSGTAQDWSPWWIMVAVAVVSASICLLAGTVAWLFKNYQLTKRTSP